MYTGLQYCDSSPATDSSTQRALVQVHIMLLRLLFTECDRCDKPGHICDPDTGRCVCPPLTTGPACDRCQLGSWGYEPGKGCKVWNGCVIYA